MLLVLRSSGQLTYPGSIARIGPNTLVTTDEELIRKMNAFRGSSYTKGKFYGVFKFDADHENSFSELNEEKHASMRNRVTTGVTKPYLIINRNCEADKQCSIQARTIQPWRLIWTESSGALSISFEENISPMDHLLSRWTLRRLPIILQWT